MAREFGGGESHLTGWLLPGALLALAAVLLVVTLALQGGPAASPSAEPSPTPGDEHEIATDNGIVSFRYDGASIVIRLATDSTTIELGRVDLLFMASAPPGGTPMPAGTSLFAMVCNPAAGPGASRYVFGRFDDALDLEYTGPDAVGRGASDGLFLFALLPGPIDHEDRIELEGRDGSGGFPASIFERAPDIGRLQPSGCYVAG
jgi:hypothetical protein